MGASCGSCSHCGGEVRCSTQAPLTPGEAVARNRLALADEAGRCAGRAAALRGREACRSKFKAVHAAATSHTTAMKPLSDGRVRVEDVLQTVNGGSDKERARQDGQNAGTRAVVPCMSSRQLCRTARAQLCSVCVVPGLDKVRPSRELTTLGVNQRGWHESNFG